MQAVAWPKKTQNTKQQNKQTNKKMILRDFPCGPVVKNLPYNAGDLGSIPGQGAKIPRATGKYK